MTDRELARRILTRDQRALLLFYKTYTPKLTTLISSRVGDARDGEEILQDTLFAFLESLRDYVGTASIRSFLYAICHHKIVDYYRRKKIKHLLFSQLPSLESLISTLLTPEEELDKALLREKIRTVLGKLVPGYREVLILKYLENFSMAAIAEKLSVTVKSVESRLFRARKAFVELFVSI